MKKLVLGCSLLIALLLNQTAAADDRHHRRGYSSSSYGNGYGYHDPRVNPYHYGSSNSRFYGSHSGSYTSFPHYSRHRSSHYNRQNDEWAYFFGGAILGSMFTPRLAPIVRPREIVYVNKPTALPTPTPIGRSLLKDLEGNCFERIVDDAGNEMRVQLEADACNF